jgi:hypothetical protein
MPMKVAGPIACKTSRPSPPHPAGVSPSIRRPRHTLLTRIVAMVHSCSLF